MRDVIWTIITVWLVYRIYSAFSNRKTIVFQKHEHHHYTNDEIKIKKDPAQSKKTKSKLDNVEDVDFEEIK
jgi:hypothetical protein